MSDKTYQSLFPNGFSSELGPVLQMLQASMGMGVLPPVVPGYMNTSDPRAPIGNSAIDLMSYRASASSSMYAYGLDIQAQTETINNIVKKLAVTLGAEESPVSEATIRDIVQAAVTYGPAVAMGIAKASGVDVSQVMSIFDAFKGPLGSRMGLNSALISTFKNYAESSTISGIAQSFIQQNFGTDSTLADTFGMTANSTGSYMSALKAQGTSISDLNQYTQSNFRNIAASLNANDTIRNDKMLERVTDKIAGNRGMKYAEALSLDRYADKIRKENPDNPDKVQRAMKGLQLSQSLSVYANSLNNNGLAKIDTESLYDSAGINSTIESLKTQMAGMADENENKNVLQQHINTLRTYNQQLSSNNFTKAELQQFRQDQSFNSRRELGKEWMTTQNMSTAEMESADAMLLATEIQRAMPDMRLSESATAEAIVDYYNKLNVEEQGQSRSLIRQFIGTNKANGEELNAEDVTEDSQFIAYQNAVRNQKDNIKQSVQSNITEYINTLQMTGPIDEARTQKILELEKLPEIAAFREYAGAEKLMSDWTPYASALRTTESVMRQVNPGKDFTEQQILEFADMVTGSGLKSWSGDRFNTTVQGTMALMSMSGVDIAKTVNLARMGSDASARTKGDLQLGGIMGARLGLAAAATANELQKQGISINKDSIMQTFARMGGESVNNLSVRQQAAIKYFSDNMTEDEKAAALLKMKTEVGDEATAVVEKILNGEVATPDEINLLGEKYVGIMAAMGLNAASANGILWSENLNETITNNPTILVSDMAKRMQPALNTAASVGKAAYANNNITDDRWVAFANDLAKVASDLTTGDKKNAVLARLKADYSDIYAATGKNDNAFEALTTQMNMNTIRYSQAGTAAALQDISLTAANMEGSIRQSELLAKIQRNAPVIGNKGIMTNLLLELGKPEATISTLSAVFAGNTNLDESTIAFLNDNIGKIMALNNQRGILSDLIDSEIKGQGDTLAESYITLSSKKPSELSETERKELESLNAIVTRQARNRLSIPASTTATNEEEITSNEVDTTGTATPVENLSTTEESIPIEAPPLPTKTEQEATTAETGVTTEKAAPTAVTKPAEVKTTNVQTNETQQTGLATTPQATVPEVPVAEIAEPVATSSNAGEADKNNQTKSDEPTKVIVVNEVAIKETGGGVTATAV